MIEKNKQNPKEAIKENAKDTTSFEFWRDLSWFGMLKIAFSSDETVDKKSSPQTLEN